MDSKLVKYQNKKELFWGIFELLGKMQQHKVSYEKIF
jgi:hypothetical protein